MRSVQVLVCGLLLLGLAGCGQDGKKGPQTANVSGTVTFKNAPLADAEVYFVSPDDTFGSFGKTDANGKYTLAQGAVVGKNKVYISKKEGEELPELNSEEGMDAGQLEAQQIGNPGVAKQKMGPKQLIPPEYSDPEKSKLTYEVPEGGSDSANFTLQ